MELAPVPSVHIGYFVVGYAGNGACVNRFMERLAQDADPAAIVRLIRSYFGRTRHA